MVVNTTIKETLLEIRDYDGIGYKPIIDYGEWRVALLRHHDDMLPANIEKFQRHHETDEVFVLLAGKCILFIGEGDEQITEIYGQDMEPLKLYNIKRRTWHFHTVTDDATVLIVENCNTSNSNSAEIMLTAEQKDRICELTHVLWAKA